MIFTKSKIFLLIWTILSTIGIISAIVLDNNVTVNEIQDCTTKFYDATEDVFGYVTRERNVYENCVNYHNYTLCLNTSGANTDCSQEQLVYNVTCAIGTESYQSYEKVSEQVVQKNKTICNKRAYTIDIADSTKNINFSKAGYYCSLEGNIVTCDSVHDGNGDGKCKSGETCIKFEITSQGINTLQKRIDSVALKDIEVEDV